MVGRGGEPEKVKVGHQFSSWWKGVGYLNVGPVYRVGQVEIGHSSKTSLIQETEGENLPREKDFRPFSVVL